MTPVEQIYTQLPLDLQRTQLLYEHFAGDSKLKMKLRVDAAVIAFEKTKKLHNELSCGINTSVANCIDDDDDIPSEDDLLQFFDGLKHCHAATLQF
eukprot:5118545-Ditylum_brightwellii.AAC.1